MTTVSAFALLMLLWSVPIKFPEPGWSLVEIIFRWVHYLAGITWIGLLYFFNLVNVPVMKALDGPTKGKVVPVLLPKALWWFRWGAVVTVLTGLYWFAHTMSVDADNSGNPGQLWKWFGIWLVTWIVAWAIISFLTGPVNDGRLLALLVIIVVLTASWVVLSSLGQPGVSNKSLSIGVGGGIGLVMLLNVWGIIWPAQKRIIAWTKANAEQGTPMPPEAAKLGRRAFLASRTNAWLSIPMLFFMGAASHYPMFGQ